MSYTSCVELTVTSMNNRLETEIQCWHPLGRLPSALTNKEKCKGGFCLFVVKGPTALIPAPNDLNISPR